MDTLLTRPNNPKLNSQQFQLRKQKTSRKKVNGYVLVAKKQKKLVLLEINSENKTNSYRFGWKVNLKKEKPPKL